MSHDLRNRFDRGVLKPFWVLFLVLGVQFAVRMDFFNAAVFLIAGFFGVARIGVGLFPEKSFEQLAHPKQASEFASVIDQNPHDSFFLAARAMFRLAFLGAMVMALFGWHAGAPWLRVIGALIASYASVVAFSGISIGYMSRLPPTENRT